MQKEFIWSAYNNITKAEQKQKDDPQVLAILSDIVRYFKAQDQRRTNQYRIGVQNLFKGYVIKD